jgi:hypothetical protein
MYDKALVNAIIHEGFDPTLKIIWIGCEKCRNPWMYHHFANQQYFDDGSRTSIYVLQCPECGTIELDFMGCKVLDIPNIKEDTLVYIGKFLQLWLFLIDKTEMFNSGK